MARLMSVAYTEQAVVERRKTVTRRKGWTFLKPGDRLTLCRKVMGRKKGEPLVRLAEVEVVSVRRESLELLAYPMPDTDEWGYAWAEVEREGFPLMGPAYFVHKFFLDAQGIDPSEDVTRIEWRYLDHVHPDPYVDGAWWATCDHGDHVWTLHRGNRHLARRSLNAHLRHDQGIEVPAR